MNEVTAVIRDVGFPIFVAVYMLIQNTKQMKEFTTALNELKLAITKMSGEEEKEAAK